MITLNDYLYSGDTVFRIIQKYIEDLRKEAKTSRNEVDMMHCNFLIQILELLEHNEFLTVQSQKIRDFYMYMAKKYRILHLHLKVVSSHLFVPRRNLTGISLSIFIIIIRKIKSFRLFQI